MPTRLSIVGDVEQQERLERIAIAMYGRPMVRAMQRATNLVLRDAKRYAPVDTGRLRGSITQTVKSAMFPRRVVGVVGTPVKYAPHQEYGTDHSKMPPPQALEGWARRHGMNAFAVAQSILARGGLTGIRYMQRSIDKNRPEVLRILNNHVRITIIGES